MCSFEDVVATPYLGLFFRGRVHPSQRVCRRAAESTRSPRRSDDECSRRRDGRLSQAAIHFTRRGGWRRRSGGWRWLQLSVDRARSCLRSLVAIFSTRPVRAELPPVDAKEILGIATGDALKITSVAVRLTALEQSGRGYSVESGPGIGTWIGAPHGV